MVLVVCFQDLPFGVGDVAPPTLAKNPLNGLHERGVVVLHERWQGNEASAKIVVKCLHDAIVEDDGTECDQRPLR